MKLVEILARELSEWPEDVHVFVQDKDGYGMQVWAMRGPVENLKFKEGEWMPGDEVWPKHESSFVADVLASDHATAIVTRAQWQAEKKRIAISNKEGWIRHRGGSQPVGDDVIVEIRTRGGEFETCAALGFAWRATGDEQIMAYRVIDATVKECLTVEPVEVFNYDLERMQSAVESGTVERPTMRHDPLKWRDRINEIDATTSAFATERAELVAKLAAEGFALIEPIKRDDSAQVDMNDPSNWEIGDQVEIEWSDNCAWVDRKGFVGTVKEMPGHDYMFLDFDKEAEQWCCDPSNCKFKWHSRPAK